MQNAVDFFISGGPFMYPLLLASVLAITLILERMISSIAWTRTMKQYVRFIETRGIEGTKIPGSSESFWQKNTKDRKQETESNFQAVCEKRTSPYQILNTVGAVSPLLGFIGTISGMIGAFQSIANADKVSIKLVAAGISEALITTGFGLIIAVICIFAESVGMYLFGNFTQSIELKLEKIFKAEEDAHENR